MFENVRLAGDAPPGSEFLLPTFISSGQRKLLWATLCSVLCVGACAGAFVGISLLLVVQNMNGSDGYDTLAENEARLTPPSNASGNCTLTYDPDDVSELLREAYVHTFFNMTCLATNGTGDPCDLHLAEEYTYRMFSALRFDRLVTEFLAFVAIFSLAQIGGIPRPTNWNGMLFWLAWMATQLAQYVVILCALILQVFSFLGVRARLSPCLVQVDGTALLDFYAMCTFAVQPELVIKATMLFVYAFLLSLGMVVFDGSREWPWLSKLGNKVTAEEVLVALPGMTLTQNPDLSLTLTLNAAESAAEAPGVCAPTVRNLMKKLESRFLLAVPPEPSNSQGKVCGGRNGAHYAKRQAVQSTPVACSVSLSLGSDDHAWGQLQHVGSTREPHCRSWCHVSVGAGATCGSLGGDGTQPC